MFSVQQFERAKAFDKTGSQLNPVQLLDGD